MDGFHNLYISHFNNTNQIDVSYGNSSLTYIAILLILCILLTTQKSRGKDSNDLINGGRISIKTTNSLKGLAIIFLIIGHLSEKCIGGVWYFENAGRWAVVIFLYVSGIAISKKYGIDNLNGRYVINRIRRILIPFWGSLGLFIILDYLLLDRIYSLKRLVMAFAGLMFPWPPNGPAWFITYILFLYFLYYFVAQFRFARIYKVLLLIFLSYLMMLTIVYTRLFDYFALWVVYTAVFPVAAFVGLYNDKIFKLCKRLYNYSRVGYLIIVPSLMAIYFGGADIGWLSQPGKNNMIYHTFQPLSLIAALTLIAVIIDQFEYQSKLLMVLGKYSFEIYLLHFPFMEYYDFILFRKPLFITFFIYFGGIFILSYFLKKINDVSSVPTLRKMRVSKFLSH